MDTVYVLVCDFYESTYGTEIIGVYKTKEAVQEEFRKLLTSIWPEKIEDFTDDNGNDFERCVDELTYCCDIFRDHMYADTFEIEG